MNRKIDTLIAAGCALAAAAGFAWAADNFAATAGSGLTFAAKDNGSGVLFVRHILCDNTTTTQCAAINNTGALNIGSALGTYGTSPGAVAALTVNAFVTNANANGQATMANSSPVVLPSNMAAIPTWGHGAPAAAPPADAVYKGVLSGGATGGLLRGEVQCDSHKFFHITSATDTLAVQGVTNQKVYICSWRSRAAGVATWFLENTNDTNANCAGSKTQITGVATEAANTGETWGGAIWSGLTNTVSNGLCINSTGTGGVDIDLWYTQF